MAARCNGERQSEREKTADSRRQTADSRRQTVDSRQKKGESKEQRGNSREDRSCKDIAPLPRFDDLSPLFSISLLYHFFFLSVLLLTVNNLSSISLFSSRSSPLRFSTLLLLSRLSLLSSLSSLFPPLARCHDRPPPSSSGRYERGRASRKGGQ
eukprot:768013-Hanusia_phi.AAC.11